MARLRARVLVQDDDGNIETGATVKLYEPGTASVVGLVTTGTPFAGNIYAAITGGSPGSTTRTSDANGEVVVFTDAQQRMDVGIETSTGARVSAYEPWEFDPADVLTTGSTGISVGTDGAANGIVQTHGTAGGLRVYDRAAPYTDYNEMYDSGGVFGLYSSALGTDALTVSAVGLLTLAGDGQVIEAISTPLRDVGIGLNNLTNYTRVGISELRGGALIAASGRHANSYGNYSPAAVAYPMTAALIYATPDISDTSTSGGETSGNHTFALVRTGAGLLPGMAAGSTGPQAAVALTITAVSANSVTVSGLTTANTTDYVGWHFLVSSGAATSIARKITAHTASATPVFTLDSGTSWGTTPAISDKATLNYGQTIDYANVLSTFRDDSSIVSAGGAHTTFGFGTFGRNTATSTGNVTGFFGLLTTYSRNSLAIGSEMNPGNASNFASNYWGVASPGSAGHLVGGTRGVYDTYTVNAVNASPATQIQQTSEMWVTDEHVGKGVYVVDGTQAGAQAVVTANNGDTLTFTPSIPSSGLTGATFQLGSLWNGVALGIGTTGPDINRLGAGWRHGIMFDDYAFASEGAFGIDFKPSSGVDFPIRIPNGTALYAWQTGQTWAANYPAGTLLPATHPHVPLIGTLAGGSVTYLGTDTQMVLTSNTTGAFGAEILRLGSAGMTFAAAATVQTTGATALTLSTNSTARLALQANGDIVPGTAALATTATAGFPFIPGCAGAPTGVPTVYSGRLATVYDYTNSRLYIYTPGVGWKSALFA